MVYNYKKRIEVFRMGLKSILKDFFAPKVYLKFDETLHKYCEECGGGGVDIVAGPCLDCNGNGFIEKTRKDIWDEKINNSTNNAKI